MKKVFFFISIYALHFSLFAQPLSIDSLSKVLKTEKEDTNKTKTLFNLSSAYLRKSDFKNADSLAKLSLNLSERLNYKKGLARAYSKLAEICNYQGNYGPALKYLGEQLKVDQDMGEEKAVGNVYGNMSLVSLYMGNYSEALSDGLQSLKIAEKVGDKSSMGSCYGLIGNAYEASGNLPEALKNQLLALKCDTVTGAKDNLENDYGNIGNIYFDMGKYEESLKYQQMALKLAQRNGNMQGAGDDYVNIGNIYRAQKNFDEAAKSESMSLKIDEQIGNNQALGNVFEDLGYIYMAQGKLVLAKQYMDSAIMLGKAMGEKEILKGTYFNKVILDSLQGNFKDAYLDYKISTIYKDSLKNDENTRKMVRDQMQYDFDKKQAGEKAEQDKKDALAMSDRKRQIIITSSVSMVLLLVLVFSGLLFSRFRITQKQKRIIEEQKAIVEERNKEVLDSITYAKRLQDAILPPLSVIEKYLPESFVLYRPKDIVAGDFYWMERAGDNILIAAADCTGHGVPGAMVSVVCSNALNRTVKEFKITEPGKILDKTREMVLETFSQKNAGETGLAEIKDGMDISLCCININSKEMQWSGAYNPLWYVQNGELKEITADKQPIGKYDSPKAFNTSNLKLNKGDVFYLFTDGYADQFGGPKGKKFKYRQLQEKLISIANESMNKQKLILEETLENWQGSLEQIDDVLVIGIRV